MYSNIPSNIDTVQINEQPQQQISSDPDSNQYNRDTKPLAQQAQSAQIDKQPITQPVAQQGIPQQLCEMPSQNQHQIIDKFVHTSVINEDETITVDLPLKFLPLKSEQQQCTVIQQNQRSQLISDSSIEYESNEKLKNLKENKRYNRDFLISLKDKELSQAVPEAFKDPEVIQLLKIIEKKIKINNCKTSFNHNPSKASNSNTSKSNRSNKNKKVSWICNETIPLQELKCSQKNIEDEGKILKTPIINSENYMIKLNKAENPYQIKKHQNTSEHEELLRDVRNILNKLTPQNLQKLAGDFINLAINTEDRLKDSIDVIFEKSIDEQVFSQTYAELCKILAQIRVPTNADQTKFINFRTMLLTRCQKEFDSDYIQNINYEKLMQEAEACTDEVKQKELREIAQDKLTRAKRRSLSNIRFIGELFKFKMLTEGIMNDCIERLLKQETDEENLECLCKLLTSIGKELDKPNNLQKMKNCFDKLDKISKKKGTVRYRIRFMIMDVIDLRKNQWVPIRKDNNPKKIDEIRKEAREEQLRQEAEYAKKQQLDKQRLAQGADVKQLKNKNLNGDLTLGPGGGAGFSWNKKKTTTDLFNPSITTATSSLISSNFPQSQSFSANISSDDRGSKPRVNEQSQPTSHLSMDSTKSMGNRNLQWALGNHERTQSASVLIDSYETRLNQILENRCENEIIFDKIESEFSPADCESKAFIRALVISVCNSCLIDKKIDTDLFKKRGSILNKFIAKKLDLELDALFAIQALDHRMKHQLGFIRVLFDLLYDEDIIREDAFSMWKDEPKEEGHAISAISLKGFFEWLYEADNDASEQ